MHEYDAHYAFYQNCEIPRPWVRGSGPEARSLWLYSEHVLHLRKSSYMLLYIGKN